MATFEVGESNGLRTNLVLADSFDGSLKLTCGSTSIRVVCANTMSMFLRADGNDAAQLRHTASLEAKVVALASAIESTIATGKKVRETFKAASEMKLNRDQAQAAFDALFPEADKDATKAQITRAENTRRDAKIAATLDVNKVGDKGTLATLWNAATYLVDREITSRPEGTFRQARGGADALDSLLFGTRADRVQEIQTLVEVILRDGTVQTMPATQALDVGVDQRQVGRAILNELVPGLDN